MLLDRIPRLDSLEATITFALMFLHLILMSLCSFGLLWFFIFIRLYVYQPVPAERKRDEATKARAYLSGCSRRRYVYEARNRRAARYFVGSLATILVLTFVRVSQNPHAVELLEDAIYLIFRGSTWCLDFHGDVKTKISPRNGGESSDSRNKHIRASSDSLARAKSRK